MKPDVQTFASSSRLSAAVAACVAADLSAVLARRTRAALALPADRSWAAVAEALCAHVLDWARVSVTETDAAWPPAPDADSMRAALSGPAARHRGVSLASPAETAEAAAEAAAGIVTAHVLPLDACVLAMSADGGIAGLVPDGDALGEGLSPVCRTPVLAIRRSDVLRLTLTLPAIQSAPRICLLLSGDAGRATLAEAMAEGPIPALPVRAVLRGHRRVTAFHLADA